MSYIAYTAENPWQVPLINLILIFPFMDDFGNIVDPWEYDDPHGKYSFNCYYNRKKFLFEGILQ